MADPRSRAAATAVDPRRVETTAEAAARAEYEAERAYQERREKASRFTPLESPESKRRDRREEIFWVAKIWLTGFVTLVLIALAIGRL